jgi:hypothetical protein
LRAAWLKNPRLLPLAVTPLGFAVQQIAEGCVWAGLSARDGAWVRAAALVYLFFALAFWPWWVSVATAVLETRPARKRFLVGLSVATTAWFWVLYFPLVNGPDALLSVTVVRHSLVYSYFDLGVYQYVPRDALRALYLLSVVLPFAVGPKLFGWLPGVLLLGSVVVAAAVYQYAFISVWCFFAAALTGTLCAVLYRLPARSLAPA